jgi:murein DD-endopeptidase MepM/ murein hydrolase activator NlpD
LYHIGFDIKANETSPVYAIADGEVYRRSTSGWGTDNVGLLIKHKLADGTDFLALYGHIRSSLNVGDKVQGGIQFATIGPYSSPHLHFGIHPAVSAPLSGNGYGFGRMSNSRWPDTNGFTDPINWIQSSFPLINLDDQAKRDMINRAARDSRFYGAILSSFGVDQNWSPDWVLRWIYFNVSYNRTAPLVHATSKWNQNIRYVMVWDPDASRWLGWEAVPWDQ